MIHKLGINKVTDWCHNLVLVCKPSGKLRVCLDPRTINQALRFHVHNSCTFQDINSSIKKVKRVSKIDANSGFWTLPYGCDFTTFDSVQQSLGKVLLHKNAFWLEPKPIFLPVLHGSAF